MNLTKPNRKKHSYTQHLNAPPEAAFPLLCPVAESKWAPGWMPEVVFSVPGVVEQECMNAFLLRHWSFHQNHRTRFGLSQAMIRAI